MMPLAPSFLFFGVCVTRGAEGMEAFMASCHPWDGYQVACRFDSSVVGHHVVWSSKESHPINRESSPRSCIFSFASHSSGQ